MWAPDIENKNFLSATWVILSYLSSDPERRSYPFDEKESDLTAAECVFTTCECPSTVLFQSLIVLSAEQDAITLP